MRGAGAKSLDASGPETKDRGWRACELRPGDTGLFPARSLADGAGGRTKVKQAVAECTGVSTVSRSLTRTIICEPATLAWACLL